MDAFSPGGEKATVRRQSSRRRGQRKRLALAEFIRIGVFVAQRCVQAALREQVCGRDPPLSRKASRNERFRGPIGIKDFRDGRERKTRRQSLCLQRVSLWQSTLPLPVL